LPGDRVEEPGPVEAGKEAWHRPWQEDQRLGKAATIEGLVEQECEDQPEGKLQDDRGTRPPERVLECPVEVGVLAERLKMVKTDEAAGKRIEKLDIAKRIGNAERQRHEHHRNDQDQCRRAVEIGFRRIGHALE